MVPWLSIPPYPPVPTPLTVAIPIRGLLGQAKMTGMAKEHESEAIFKNRLAALSFSNKLFAAFEMVAENIPPYKRQLRTGLH
ncbi:hypothetical protein AVEN_232395-1 [Araneus ventricosus]|uniref:Uncharacterized protein n=1 Tax=Araneus ventricosus TaxID=182803 RepID=A0A4Y2CV34_ARAVE|nr:hypothetical protein AVEN_232395-1 [Araneus ventricosus]